MRGMTSFLTVEECLWRTWHNFNNPSESEQRVELTEVDWSWLKLTEVDRFGQLFLSIAQLSAMKGDHPRKGSHSSPEPRSRKHSQWWTKQKAINPESTPLAPECISFYSANLSTNNQHHKHSSKDQQWHSTHINAGLHCRKTNQNLTLSIRNITIHQNRKSTSNHMPHSNENFKQLVRVLHEISCEL